MYEGQSTTVTCPACGSSAQGNYHMYKMVAAGRTYLRNGRFEQAYRLQVSRHLAVQPHTCSGRAGTNKSVPIGKNGR